MRGRVEWPADGQRVGVGGGPAPRGHLQLGGLHRRVGVGRSSGRSGRLRLVLLLHHLQIEAVDLVCGQLCRISTLASKDHVHI